MPRITLGLLGGPNTKVLEGTGVFKHTNKEHHPEQQAESVEVNDLKHLTGIISQLKARPVVSKVERING